LKVRDQRKKSWGGTDLWKTAKQGNPKGRGNYFSGRRVVEKSPKKTGKTSQKVDEKEKKTDVGGGEVQKKGATRTDVEL